MGRFRKGVLIKKKRLVSCRAVEHQFEFSTPKSVNSVTLPARAKIHKPYFPFLFR